MESQLAKFIIEAQGKSKDEISSENPYRDIGFDGNNKRLGWMRIIPFSKIESWFEQIQTVLNNKERFIFIGMGGSSNGIKSLLALNEKHNCYVLDSLDPAALAQIIDKIKSNPLSAGKLNKTLIIPISKSGTTKETQQLANTLKELLLNELGDNHWQKNFLWLADPESFSKLDSLGWDDIFKLPIQFDEESDIGGRFACPHTAIFYLPLFLLLNRDTKRLEEVYLEFNSYLAQSRSQAYDFSVKYKDQECAYFSPIVEERLGSAFGPWVVQLFQESLGSKIEGLSVKTVVSFHHNDDMFFPLRLDLEITNSVVYLMCQMYFFQVFIAFYSAHKSINFVNQDFVEKYKEQLKKLSDQKRHEVESARLTQIIDKVKHAIKPNHKFIEIVLFFHPQGQVISDIQGKFAAVFKDRRVFVFIGSDWNHHSYQAAFGDRDTFFVLLTSTKYFKDIPLVQKETLINNIDTLKLIAQATYQTIQDKSILCAYNL
ncbi:MAG: hypothetical protein KKF54_03060 [Candidatus Omnitrophica bacterium]|nr:hypothetical protein [Candidatus Omnitrophota bacterium]